MKYRDARDTLVEAARQQLAEFADVDEPGQGMQLVARLKGAPSDVAVAEEARKRGIITRPVSRMFIQAPPVSALLLGFTGYELYRIRSAVTRLARSLEVVAHDKDERRVAYS
jgi:GntR family transcriptional regulator/MocR family aminotransferase